MPIPPARVNQGDIYWCEPDPLDLVGSEQKGDRPWVIISIARLNRGNCVVGLPISRHTEKACAHLVMIPKQEITMEDGTPSIDRVALTDQIRSLDKTRFKPRAGFVSQRAINAIIVGIEALLGNSPMPPVPMPAQTFSN
jgi:mRNA-degrading endonuclease toxin of MazEF toxin-antitoxin module